jgi:Peptidase family M48
MAERMQTSLWRTFALATAITLACNSLFLSAAQAHITIPTEKERREETRELLRQWLKKHPKKQKGQKNGIHIGLEVDDILTPNEHLTFANRYQATKWAKTALPFIAPGATILNHDSRLALLDGYVREIWQAFTVLFPEYTKSLNSPPVILLKSNTINAFVSQTIDRKQMAHAIFVFTGLLEKFTLPDGKLNKEAIMSVMGHELAHSVFLHGLTKYQARVNHFYNKSQIQWGFYAANPNLSPDTKRLDITMGRWLDDVRLAGELTAPELRDLPAPGINQNLLLLSLQIMQEQTINILGSDPQAAPSCDTAPKSFRNWRSHMIYSPLKLSIVIPPPETSALGEASDRLIEQDRSCLAQTKSAPKVSFPDIATQAFGLPIEVLVGSEDFMELAERFNAAPDAISGFQAAVHPIRTEITQIQQNVDFAKVGYYTFEQHADEVSALVLAYLKLDPGALGKVFQTLLTAASPDDADTCAQMIKNNLEPEVGSFSEIHHSLCYRNFHISMFSQAIGRDVSGFAKQFIDASIGPSLMTDSTKREN